MASEQSICKSPELSLEQVCLKLEQYRRRSESPVACRKTVQTIPSESSLWDHKTVNKIRTCGSIPSKSGVGKPSLGDERHFSKSKTSSNNNVLSYELALWTKNSSIMQRRASLLKERMEADPCSLSAAATCPSSLDPSPVRNLVHSRSCTGLEHIDRYAKEDSTTASFCRNNNSTCLPRHASHPVLSSLDANNSQHVEERPMSLPPRNRSYKVMTTVASIRKVPTSSLVHSRSCTGLADMDRYAKEDSATASFRRNNQSTCLPRHGSHSVLSSLDSQHVKERQTSSPARNRSYKVMTTVASIRKVPTSSKRGHTPDSVAADNTDRFLRSKLARSGCSLNDDEVQCSVFRVGMLLMLVTISSWIAFLHLL